MKQPTCKVIIVTHNSQKFLEKVIDSLDKQTRRCDQIIIVDSGSKDLSYFGPYKNRKDIHLIFDKEDIGFCCANNLGMDTILPDDDYVLFLNPDAFLFPNFVEQALEYMERKENCKVAVLTGTLLGYDIHKNQPTNTYDSTGIFKQWYGRWYDRAQGDVVNLNRFTEIEEPLAICGALMFCRKKALDTIILRKREVFDSSFFMYKDDIDLSLRLRRKGWYLHYIPHFHAYHCRGWSRLIPRSRIPRKLKLFSAKNEVRIHLRERSVHVLYSLFKYTLVKLFNV